MQAQAVILPAITIDGPSEDIIGFGAIAMAEDGTGGLVYLKRVNGVAHVFVSRYSQGQWLAPIRVDNGQPFAASWARIGAGEGGELVVVWATPFATVKSRPVQQLLGSTLGPGSATFGPSMIIDPNIGDGSAANPALAMSSTGQADVVYRVVKSNSSVPLLRAGDVVEEVRVAHFNSERWSRLGAVNRNSGISMRAPTTANAPQIAIGQTGNAVVVWQEPDIEGVARIWARRVFASTLDYVLPVSATSFNASAIGDDADAPTVAISRLGQAEVAYRQQAGLGSPLPGPRIFLNTLPDGESANGAAFLGAGVADSAVAGGVGATVGPPNIDIDAKQNLRLLYDSNGVPRVVQGNNRGLVGTLSLGPPFAGAEVGAASIMNPAGGGVSAWPSADAAGGRAVAVRQDFPNGAVQTALVSGGAGGEVGELSVGRSGLGDGLVAFRQGQLGNAAIVATRVTAPPEQFITNVPNGWVKPAQAVVSWLPASSADGPLSYRVVVDGRALGPANGSQRRLGALSSGRHRIQVLATDIDGQSTLTPASTLSLDAAAPTVRIKRTRGGSAVSVRVSDPGSGVKKSAVIVSYGDGRSGRRRAAFSHRYAHSGIYRVVVHVVDRLGNAGVVSRLVSVR
jgi:hypothetical protein